MYSILNIGFREFESEGGSTHTYTHTKLLIVAKPEIPDLALPSH